MTNLFFVWVEDDIDSSDFEDTDEPRPLYVCMLCRDSVGAERTDITRGYDPRDGIFERPGVVLGALGGIDADAGDEYRREIERQLLDELESRREAVLVRGEN